jgi:Cu2+-exporting ATPase
MTVAAGSACFHCGEPIPAGLRIHARIDGREEPVCCHGCKAVAEFITGAGLDDYYRYRDARAARADEPPRADRWSAYDRPELVERLTRPEPNGARSITVLLEGLRCSACSWLADKALHLQSGVLDVSVNPATARARLVWDPSKVKLGDLLRVLEHVGLRPHPLAGEPAEQLALLERRTALKRLAVAGFGMMQVMMFALPMYVGGMERGMHEFFRLVSMLICVPVAIYSGWPFYTGAWHALKARSVSMDVPVSLGIVAAFVASVVNTLTYDGVGANPASTLTLSGNTCLVMEGVFSGQAAVTGITPPTGWSSTREYDTGSEQHAVYVYDTVGSSDVSTGFTQTSDDYKVFAIALKEVLSGSFAPPRRGLREFSPMLVR